MRAWKFADVGRHVEGGLSKRVRVRITEGDVEVPVGLEANAGGEGDTAPAVECREHYEPDAGMRQVVNQQWNIRFWKLAHTHQA